jgi:hypothetical protein
MAPRAVRTAAFRARVRCDRRVGHRCVHRRARHGRVHHRCVRRDHRAHPVDRLGYDRFGCDHLGCDRLGLEFLADHLGCDRLALEFLADQLGCDRLALEFLADRLGCDRDHRDCARRDVVSVTREARPRAGLQRWRVRLRFRCPRQGRGRDCLPVDRGAARRPSDRRDLRRSEMPMRTWSARRRPSHHRVRRRSAAWSGSLNVRRSAVRHRSVRPDSESMHRRGFVRSSRDAVDHRRFDHRRLRGLHRLRRRRDHRRLRDLRRRFACLHLRLRDDHRGGVAVVVDAGPARHLRWARLRRRRRRCRRGRRPVRHRRRCSRCPRLRATVRAA